ncbi:MAG: glucose-1-phosphate thymidylyltransferase [Thermoplasmata archaeon]|nr:glucose-1-phosphate thymidylyltransferase [Thermoplasmata archaeon]
MDPVEPPRTKGWPIGPVPAAYARQTGGSLKARGDWSEGRRSHRGSASEAVKGLLLAGGHGTRLRPLTFTGNKHMIPLANQPMLFYGLRHLAEAGIREVGIVLGPIREGIEEAVGDGGRFGLSVTYIEQGEPRGLADAVRCAHRPFLGSDPFVMYLGDNVLQEGVLPLADAFRAATPDAIIGVTRVADPSRFGIVEMAGDRIVSIEEKPAAPRSDLALIGVYVFGPQVHSIIEGLSPSARGELEITDAIWRLHQRRGRVLVRPVEGWWKDTGRPEDLLEANERILRSMPDVAFLREGTVTRGGRLDGSVALGKGATVGADVVVRGPVVIGDRAVLSDGAQVGPAVAVGAGAVIRGAQVERSIILEGARIEGPIHLRDSIVGRDAVVNRSATPGAETVCVVGDSTQIAF